MGDRSRITASRPAYLPDNWDNDVEMSGLMSYLKARYVNPTNYDRVVSFWKSTILDYCRHQKRCVFTQEELKIKFKRGSQLPSPLPTVISELKSEGLVVERSDFEKDNQSWLQWGANLISPSSWLQGLVGSTSNNPNTSQLIHITALKELAKELLRYYRNNYEMVDCPDIVGYNELQENASHIIDRDCFELVIIELVNMGEVSVGSSKDGDKVLKFKDQRTKGPARFSENDAAMHDLKQTMARLDTAIMKAEKREQTLKLEAKAAMNRGDKKGALNIMKKVALIRKEVQDKEIQYQRLHSVFQQLTDSKHKKDMIDVLKTCSVTVKETLNRHGLTPEKVDTTMDDLLETMQDYRDMNEALHDGLRSMSSVDVPDEELESELNELIREDEAARVKEVSPPLILPRPFPVENGNRVRVGKRVLDLSDLPEVPSGGPSTSSANRNGRDDSLEERWKRLRMHAT
uniref:Charged multivesicular body protein 7 n=1 Tax=Meloidogyne javanica TaxID=6303 RepID=A0A915M5G5_MELJA